MARKNASQLQKEYVSAITTVESVEAKIKARAIQLCKLHPQAPIGRGAVGREINKLSSGDFFDTTGYLYVIKSIEDYNERESGHVQTTLYPKS
jgi:hypothetical protein